MIACHVWDNQILIVPCLIIALRSDLFFLSPSFGSTTAAGQVPWIVNTACAFLWQSLSMASVDLTASVPN
ncbi:hypothetical protein ACJX0J_025098, partial [Zea mays]